MEPTQSFSIGMLLLDGFNGAAMQAFLDPFRSSNYLRGTKLYEWHFLGLQETSAKSNIGLDINNLSDFLDDDLRLDLLVINASWAPERYYSAALNNKLRQNALRGTTLCGLDTGAFLLANSGLLNGKKATCHYEHIASFRELFPKVIASENLFVIDDLFITCCGGIAAADLALEIIHQHHGLAMANGAGRYIFQQSMRAGHQGQLEQSSEATDLAIPKKLRDAIELMARHLEQPLAISEISSQVGSSQRQLERLFKAHTGESPVRYYIDARLDRARGLVTQTNMSVLSVAIASGFSSGAQFSRTYFKRFGLSPSKDRLEGRVPFQFRASPSHMGIHN